MPNTAGKSWRPEMKSYPIKIIKEVEEGKQKVIIKKEYRDPGFKKANISTDKDIVIQQCL